MTDNDLADLLHDAAERTDPGQAPVGAILAASARGRRRQVWGTVGVAAAAVVAVVAAIVVPLDVARSTGTAPVGPATPDHSASSSQSIPAEQTEAQQIIAAGEPIQAEESPSGEIATIWVGSGSALAWQMVSGGKTLVGLVPGNDPSDVVLTATGDAFLLTDPQGPWQGAELDFAGHVTPLHRVSQLTMWPGRVLVAGWRGEETVDPKTGAWAPAFGGDGQRLDAGTTLAETEWAETTVSGKPAITRRTDDGPWHTSALPGRLPAG